MRKTVCIFIVLLLSLSSLMAVSDPIADMIEVIGGRPDGRSISIVWSSSMATLGNVQINHRVSRFYEYIDSTPGDCKYLKLIYYPREIAGNAILSLEKEHQTFVYEGGSGIAKEIEYMPPEALFSFYIPSNYEIIDEDVFDDGSRSITITDGELDYEYLIGKDLIPDMLVMNDHETKKLISKNEYDLFSSNHAYGNDFLIPPATRSWYRIHPHDTYVQTYRDTLMVDFPDEVFTLGFLESL